MELYSWQKDCLNRLRMNSYRGIVVAVTGSGKTRIALESIKEIRRRTLIVVPTIALMNQWKDELSTIGVKKEDIGLYYGIVKNKQKVTIAVINSVYEEKNLGKEFSFLVLDEVHRLGANEFSKLLLNNKFEYALGLTATLERTDGKHDVIKQCVGDVIYEYRTDNAVRDNLLNEFDIVNYGLDLPQKEKEYLARLDSDIKVGMGKFDNDMNKVVMAISKGNRVAGRTLSLISKRKQFFNNSLPKIEKAVQLVVDNVDKKIIVFGEYIESIDVLHDKLKAKGISSYVYYSGNKDSKFKLNAKDKRELLDNFRSDKSGVLLTVKALDEGLNVVDLEVGIVLGYNKTSRQAIQRMGRILRKKEGKRPMMYILYYRNTSDLFNAKNFSEKFKDIATIRWK
jgi:superfamily II DNA or RNA helicase